MTGFPPLGRPRPSVANAPLGPRGGWRRRTAAGRARASLAAGVLAAAGLGAGGCVSGQDIEGLRTQISDVQRQVLAVQKQSSSKEEIGSLSASFSKQMEALLKTEADMQVRLQDLSTQIESLKAKLEDTNFRLAQLSQQIASNNQEMKSFRSEGGAGPPAPAPPPPPPPPPRAAARGRRQRSAGPLQLRLQRLPQGQLRPRHARVPRVP